MFFHEQVDKKSRICRLDPLPGGGGEGTSYRRPVLEGSALKGRRLTRVGTSVIAVCERI